MAWTPAVFPQMPFSDRLFYVHDRWGNRAVLPNGRHVLSSDKNRWPYKSKTETFVEWIVHSVRCSSCWPTSHTANGETGKRGRRFHNSTKNGGPSISSRTVRRRAMKHTTPRCRRGSHSPPLFHLFLSVQRTQTNFAATDNIKEWQSFRS